MPPWPSHTWVRSFIVASRTNTLVFVHSCLACQLHLFVIRLGRTQLGSGHWITFDSSSNQPPSYWTHSRLKTATPEVVIHDKFPPEQAVLASQNAMRLVRSETVSITSEFIKPNAYTHSECSYWSITFVSEIFNMIFIAIEWLYKQSGDEWSTERLSLICIRYMLE